MFSHRVAWLQWLAVLYLKLIYFFKIPCVKVLLMEVLYVSDTMCPRHLYSYFLIIVIERNGSIHFTQKIIIWYNMAIFCTCICRYTASLYLVQVFLVGAAMWHIYCIHSFLWIEFFFLLTTYCYLNIYRILRVGRRNSTGPLDCLFV